MQFEESQVDGMDQLRSVSAPGNSIVIATFNLDRNVDTAAQDDIAEADVRSALLREDPVQLPSAESEFDRPRQGGAEMAAVSERQFPYAAGSEYVSAVGVRNRAQRR